MLFLLSLPLGVALLIVSQATRSTTGSRAFRIWKQLVATAYHHNISVARLAGKARVAWHTKCVQPLWFWKQLLYVGSRSNA